MSELNISDLHEVSTKKAAINEAAARETTDPAAKMRYESFATYYRRIAAITQEPESVTPLRAQELQESERIEQRSGEIASAAYQALLQKSRDRRRTRNQAKWEFRVHARYQQRLRKRWKAWIASGLKSPPPIVPDFVKASCAVWRCPEIGVTGTVYHVLYAIQKKEKRHVWHTAVREAYSKGHRVLGKYSIEQVEVSSRKPPAARGKRAGAGREGDTTTAKEMTR